MNDGKVKNTGQPAFIQTKTENASPKENTSNYIGMSVVHKNSMFRLAKTPLSLQSCNLAKIPLQTRANTRTQKSQLAAESGNASQRQQASGAQQTGPHNDDA